MNKVAIVYWSGTGNTEQMAQAVAEANLNRCSLTWKEACPA